MTELIDITPQLYFLNNHQGVLNDHIAQSILLTKDKVIRNISEDYTSTIQKRKVDTGLNLFTLISNIYHQENFHSDILKMFLDPDGKHCEGIVYLKLFLEFINALGAKINVGDYINVTVKREKGKVDLLIQDHTSKRAIIIENKINGAPDMIRQLPRYLEFVTTMGYRCDAIIYLRLNKTKYPDTYTWSESEKKEINEKLIVVNAYNETNNDLINGWINKCEKKSNNPDASLILRQYGALINKLGGNVMNKQIMEKFYTEMFKGENFKTASSIRSMMDDLILYRVENIIEKFQNNPHPFKSVFNYKDYAAIFFTLNAGKSDFSIDIIVKKEGYSFEFWDRNYNEVGENPAKLLLDEMQLGRDFTESGNRMKKEFPFPDQEQELFNYISVFKDKLDLNLRKYVI